jgi:pimeloyl-ACP methyl ester carboxylesterase
MRIPGLASALPLVLLGAAVRQTAAAPEEWEAVLDRALKAEHSQTRQDGVKQIDTKSVKGLKALWAVLAIRDPSKVDWYVREGAYEALANATGEEAEKEIVRVLKEGLPKSPTSSGGGSGGGASGGGDLELAKEAIIYSIIWRVRRAVVKEYGGNDDNQINEVKYKLRKSRGVEYFDMVLPVVKINDAEKKYLGWIQLAMNDKSTRVRRAAITGLLTYPDQTSIPLLIENLRKLEKQKPKLYREWVLTRNALETLSGQNFRESVEDWARWWEIEKNKFTIAKLVEETKGKEGEGKKSGTYVAKKDGVEVQIHVKIAGPSDTGYPLVVLPLRGYEVDYFRPYFHGVEEFCRVYYVRMPQIEDYKGLKREEKSNLITYPTAVLSVALKDILQQIGLDKFAIFGHGPDASALAMMVAADDSNRTTHLIMINPRSSGGVYGNAMENVRREGMRLGNREIVKGIDSITRMQDGKKKYDPSDSAEAEGFGRALNNLEFADPTEPETGAFGYLYDLPGGVGLMNDDKWSTKGIFQGKRTDFPVLIFMGEKAPWTPISDMNVVSGTFKKATVVKMGQSSETPFLSETYLFTKSIEDFLRPAIVAAEKAKGKEKEKTKAKGKTSAKKP